MKIAFVGDSFCADSDPGSWLDLVLKEYNAEMICKGRSGDCLYHSLNDLFRHHVISNVDYVIFCVTGADRLANPYKLPLNAGRYDRERYKWWKETDFESLSENYELPPMKVKKLMESAHKYYTDLADFGFHHIAQHGILKITDQLMIEKKKKCIWFPCFEDSMRFAYGSLYKKIPFHVEYFNHFIPKSGLLGNIALYDISYNELISQGMTNAEAEKGSRNDGRFNHLNEENNINMARLIIDTIKRDNFKPKEIKMEDYFGALK